LGLDGFNAGEKDGVINTTGLILGDDVDTRSRSVGRLSWNGGKMVSSSLEDRRVSGTRLRSRTDGRMSLCACTDEECQRSGGK
jgi:hypothetical protein